VELLREKGEQQHYRVFRRMTEAYFTAYESGDAEAIAAMIDFYGGAGAFASWPPRVRGWGLKRYLHVTRDAPRRIPTAFRTPRDCNWLQKIGMHRDDVLQRFNSARGCVNLRYPPSEALEPALNAPGPHHICRKIHYSNNRANSCRRY
jgi:hypothetical protein